MLIPKEKNQLPIIIEFKKSPSHKDLEKTASKGLKQIKEKKEVFIKMEHHLLT